MAGQNPIKASHLYEDTGEILKVIAQLKEFESGMDNVRKRAKTLKDELAGLSTEQEDSKDKAKKASKEADELAKAYKNYEKSISDTQSELIRLRKETAKNNQVTRLQIKLADSAEGSYDQLSAQYSLNKIRLNQMSDAQRNATKQGKLLEKQTKEIYERMKELQEATGKHTLSIGDYSKGTAELLDKLSAMPGAAGAAGAGVSALGNTLIGLAKNPVVLTITAIIAGLTALFGLFRRTSRGADLLARASGVLDGVLSVLVGSVDSLVDTLDGVFDDPLGSIKKLGLAIGNNLLNRLKAIVDLGVVVGNVFEALYKRDFPALTKASEDAKTALIQLGFGLDAEQQKRFGQAISDTTKEVNDQIAAFAALEQKKRDVRRENRELEKSIEQLTTQEQLLLAVFDDDTRGFTERTKVAEEYFDILDKRSAQAVKVARSNLGLINEELALRKANGENVEDLLDQQLDAYKQLAQAERDYLLTQQDSGQKQRKLRSDLFERDLDILIDGYEFRKSIIERQLKDETLSFEERKKLLDQASKLGDESLAKQIETVQKFTDVQLNANEILSEENAVLLNERIRALGLSEIYEGRLLEIVKERAIATQDLKEAEKELSNAEKASRKQAFDNAFALFESQEQVKQSEIDLTKKTEAEKARISIEAERKLLEQKLLLNKQYGNVLSDLQVQQIKDQLAVLGNELARVKDSNEFDIYKAIGLDISDEGKEAVQESYEYATDILDQYTEYKLATAEAAVEASQAEVDAAQNRLDAEIDARNQGYANNVAQAQKDLALAQANEQKALKQREEAAKQQRRIDTISQAVSLVTASAKIFSQFGMPWAIPILALMWGSFAAAKIKAAQVTKEQSFGEGGIEMLEGGSHASGNDITLGNNRGRRIKAEGGEYMAIFNKRVSSKFKGQIPDVVDSINKGTFFENAANAFKPELQSEKYFINSGVDSPYLSSMDKNISRMANQADYDRVEGNYRVIKKGNYKRKIRIKS